MRPQTSCKVEKEMLFRLGLCTLPVHLALLFRHFIKLQSLLLF